MEPKQEQAPLGVWISTAFDAIAATLKSDETTTKDADKEEAVRRTAWAWLTALPVEIQEAVPTEYWDGTIKILFRHFERTHDAIVRHRERAEAPATLAARARFYSDLN